VADTVNGKEQSKCDVITVNAAISKLVGSNYDEVNYKSNQVVRMLPI
jgi:hypothetical protein